MGPRGRMLAPLIISLFLFLLVSNWLGLIPTLSSPTNDLNTTLGLALMVIVMLHVMGVYFKGMHYIKHFFQPVPVFVIINAIEEVIIILLKLMPIWMPIPSVIWLAFSIFIGGVQAFIFTMLSMAYLANAVREDP